MRTLFGLLLASAVFGACAASPAQGFAAEPTKIVMIAGRPSHGPGDHEFNAGILLLAKCLRESGLGIDPVVVKGGWPEKEAVFDGASSVVFFMDGGGGHPM